MKRYLLISMMVMVMVTVHSQAGELQRIRERGTITISLNRDYPPFSMQKGETLLGLDVDLALLLADYLDVKAKFVRPETYDQQIPQLLAGESDIIMAAMTRTVERGLQVNFSKPYFEVSQAALVRRDKVPVGANAYFDLLAIDGLRLGVKTGTTHEDFARQLFPAGAITGYPTAAAAADAVVKGTVDAMVSDSPFVQVWHNTHVQHYQQVAALLAPVTREFYAFAVRQGDSDFLSWLNLFVDQILTDGTLDLLKHEYFEQMAWATDKMQPLERLNRAQFLKNRFVAEKQAMIENPGTDVRSAAVENPGTDNELITVPMVASLQQETLSGQPAPDRTESLNESVETESIRDLPVGELLPATSQLSGNQDSDQPGLEAQGQAIAVESRLSVAETNEQLVDELLADPSDYSVATDGSIEIQASETLGHYAEWLGTRASDIRRLNSMAFREPVIIGERLKLDFSSVSSSEFEVKRRNFHVRMQQEFFSSYRIQDVEHYQVAANDNIGAIARRRYSTPIWLLRQYNPSLDFNRVQIGQEIVFPLLEQSE